MGMSNENIYGPSTADPLGLHAYQQFSNNKSKNILVESVCESFSV